MNLFVAVGLVLLGMLISELYNYKAWKAYMKGRCDRR